MLPEPPSAPPLAPPNHRGAVALAVALAALLAGPLRGQPPAETPRYDETVEVTLVTTSVYVVDGEGKPVRDLRADEVEVRVGGKLLPLAHFEPAAAELAASDQAPAAAAGGAPVPRPAVAAERRHVFLFFDLAFSLPRGLVAAKRVASDLVGTLPASDLLYLVTFHSQRGLEQELGPVRDAPGREALLGRLATLQPNVERLRRREDLQPIAQGKKFSGHVEAGYAEAHALNQSAYVAEGAKLAESLDSFATFIRQIPGPKAILYFTQGIDSDLYGGSEAGVVVGRNSRQGAARRGGLRSKFDPALESLAQTGAMLFFVDPIVGFEPDDRVEIAVDADAAWVNDAPTGGGTLELMSQTSGGMVVRDPNPKTLERKLDGWLQARYELGVYLEGAVAGAPLAADIKIRRPDVRSWTSVWLQPPRTVRDLVPSERAFLAVQLMLAADPRMAMRNVAAPALEQLAGTSRRVTTGEQVQLRWEPDAWDASMMLRGLELFVIVIEPGDPPKLARLEQRTLTPTPAHEAVETTVAMSPGLLWGLVAYDLDTGKVYLGRFPAEAAAGG